MDLEAIDAPIERAAASQKLQAVTEENTKGADTVKARVNGSMPRAAPCTSYEGHFVAPPPVFLDPPPWTLDGLRFLRDPPTGGG